MPEVHTPMAPRPDAPLLLLMLSVILGWPEVTQGGVLHWVMPRSPGSSAWLGPCWPYWNTP